MAEPRPLTVGDLGLAAVEAGAGGRPLLLVHGFTGGKHDFAGHVDDLAGAGWHVVAYDQRGHGESGKPPAESAYAFDVLAADLLGVLDALGWDRAVVLGHSMGGMVAQVAALRAPGRFAGLVLMDTGPGRLAVDRDMAERAQELCRELGMAQFADVLDARGPGPLESEAARRVRETRPEIVRQRAWSIRACSPAMYAAMLGHMLDAEDRLPALAGLDLPTLVLVGEQDELLVEPSRRMAAAIPGARLEVIPDAGHSPQEENPAAWAKALGAFLDALR
jgi:pimeloyl-ACP methyl ester carboxylesterase